MTKAEILDMYYIEARHKLIDVAGFLDRVARAGGAGDFRLEVMGRTIRELGGGHGDAAERLLLAFSDPTTEPLAVAPGKGACGAWPGAAVGNPDRP